MPKRFAATENALEKGLANVSPATGAKLAAKWAEELAKLDVAGAKGLHNDLLQLEKELKKDKANGDHVKKILGKIGPETLKLADKCDDPTVADKVRSLGNTLSQSGN